MNITINGQSVVADPSMTILEAAKGAGIHIPTLCYLKDINKISSCRICVVQVNGSPKLMPACSTKVSDGMNIETENETVRAARKTALELMCADHRMECTECPSGSKCELRDLIHEYEADDRAFGKGKRARMTDESTTYLVRDNSKCILCRRCLSTCAVIQGTGAIAINNKGADVNVGFAHGLELKDTRCIGCGQCVAACPTGALSVRDDTKEVWKALYDKTKYVVIGISPDTAISLGKMFGEKEKINNAGKIAAILKNIGFDMVIDSGSFNKAFKNEVLKTVANTHRKDDKPLLSSSCQAWLNYVRFHKPELLEYIIDMPRKSGFVAKKCKEYLNGIDKEVYYVDISNCLSAKTTVTEYVDSHITTKELFTLIRRACVSNFTANQVWEEIEAMDFDKLPNAENSSPLKEVVNESYRTEEYDGKEIKIASITGMRNTMMFLRKNPECDFVEVYACPGGCVNGGGA